MTPTSKFLNSYTDYWLSGCFTTEYCLRGRSLTEIFVELGLPYDRLKDGASIVWAIQPPAFNNFHLAGWTKFPIDLFSTIDTIGKLNYSEAKYKEFFGVGNAEVKMSKGGWKWNLKGEKLVKVLPAIRTGIEPYPMGGQAGQIIVINPIACQVACTLQPHEVFRGVFN